MAEAPDDDEEGQLEFSLDEAVRMLIAHYGSQRTRSHVLELISQLENDNVAAL